MDRPSNHRQHDRNSDLERLRAILAIGALFVCGVRELLAVLVGKEARQAQENRCITPEDQELSGSGMCGGLKAFRTSRSTEDRRFRSCSYL